MNTVKALLKSKDNQTLFTIAPGEGMFFAAKGMKKKKVGSLLVFEKDNFLGIVTERDIVWEVGSESKRLKKALVRDIMTPIKDVICVYPHTSLEECMQKMKIYKIRHLPVLDGKLESKKIVGIISIRDLVVGEMMHQQDLMGAREAYENNPS